MEVSGRRKKKGCDDLTTGILCDPCLGVNVEENAVFYCTECNEFLCNTDAKKHRKAAMSKNHQLLDRNSMPIKKLGSYEDTICSIHKGEFLKYFCNSHDKSCCSVCATQEHKHCEIECIDDIAKGYEHGSEYKSLIKNMTELTRRLCSVKQHTVDNKSNAHHLHSEIVSEIRKFRLEMNSILDSLENASLKVANGLLHVDAAESTTKRCDTLMAELQDMMSSIENLRKYKQDRQLVMHSKNARAQVKKIEDILSKLSDLNQRKLVTFIPDKTIPKLLRSLRGLGRLEVKEETVKSDENEQKSRQNHDAEALVPVVNQHVTASHVRDINIEHSTDTYPFCWITGGVMIDQTKVVLVDRDNDSVKVVDVISNTVTSCIKLPAKPWNITRVEQDQVVLSCDRGKLVFLNVGRTLSIVKKLDLGGNIRGIAYTNNSLLVGFDSPDPCVKVMNLRGKTLKTFKTDATGNNLFKDPWNIALSEDQNTILVSDQDNACVTGLRIDGTVQGVYTEGNLKYPSGLAVDRNDNVYVAVYDNHIIHQLSAGCKPIQVLLDTRHGVEFPWMLTYSKTDHTLFIGNNSMAKRNFLSVFQLH